MRPAHAPQLSCDRMSDTCGWLTRVLPGPHIAFGIEAMESHQAAEPSRISTTAKAAEQAMATAVLLMSGVTSLKCPHPRPAPA